MSNKVKVTDVERILLVVPFAERVQRDMERARIHRWSEVEVIRVTTDDGSVGYGETLQNYTWGLVNIADRVLGRSPFEVMWEDDLGAGLQMALFDVAGKVTGLPVYRLLGGPVQSPMPAYASLLGFSTLPEDAAATATEYKAKGYTAQKWFFRYGPADGADGMALNLAMASAVREAVGPLYRIMFDAFMGWDTTYAVEMVKRLAPLNPTWMEEPIPPEKVGGLAKIRQASSVPVATGEHVYTSWQVKELLVNGAVDFLQNDPDWASITEVVKICTLASAFETPVVPHGHSLLPALHIAASQSPNTVPYVEFLVRYQETKQFFHQSILRPVDGVVQLPVEAGLGYALDEAKIESRRTL